MPYRKKTHSLVYIAQGVTQHKLSIYCSNSVAGETAADVIRVPDDVGSTWEAIKAIHG